MEVHFKPEWEAKLAEMADVTGRRADDLLEDAFAAYCQEAAVIRDMLDSRYDDLESGRVKPVDGEDVFARLRRKSEERRGPRA
ncbi:putative Addiction module protein [Candidatus Sulfopaludibacter sp. SbA4]|nr:putative Addiction module protein [Candidatus Sulfopaludibacter sp. SbA4]